MGGSFRSVEEGLEWEAEELACLVRSEVQATEGVEYPEGVGCGALLSACRFRAFPFVIMV